MRRADLQDLALAAVAVAASQVDVWVPGLFEPKIVGPVWVVALAHGVMAASLGLRRRAPFTVFGIVAGITAALALTVGASEGLSSLLPPLVAVYSVAAHGRGRRPLAAALLLVAMVVVRELNNPDNTTWTEAVNALAWNLSLAAAWLLGAYLRTRRLYIAELAERLRRIEQERGERQRRAAARAAEQERARIAREMHDVVSHGVSVMVVQADAAEAVLSRDTGAAVARLHNIQRTGRESLTELRRLLGVLQPAAEEPLAPQPGLAHLEALLASVRDSGLPVELELTGTPVRLAPGVDLAAYRVVQESLTNVLKHADGAGARVRLSFGRTDVEVEICDDGTTREGAERDGDAGAGSGPSGNGLAGMRERVALHGGVLHAAPMGPRGFRVRARLPLEAGR